MVLSTAGRKALPPRKALSRVRCAILKAESFGERTAIWGMELSLSFTVSLEIFFDSSKHNKSRIKGVYGAPFPSAERPAIRPPADGSARVVQASLNKRRLRSDANPSPDRKRLWRCVRQRPLPKGSRRKVLPLAGSLTTITEKSRFGGESVGQRLPISPSRRSMAFVNPFKEPSRRNGSPPPAAGSAST